MFKNLKALSPIVAVSLLLVVSVLSVVTFSGWFSTYSSSILSNIESQDNTNYIKIEKFIGENLYVINSNSKNQTLSNLLIGSTSCDINQSLKPGLNKIILTPCLANISYSNPIQEISVITGKKILTNTININPTLNNVSCNDINLQSSNILNGITIFGVTGKILTLIDADSDGVTNSIDDDDSNPSILDNNLISSNILNGTEIFGVVGNLQMLVDADGDGATDLIDDNDSNPSIIDNDISAINIADGVNILGVVGTLKQSNYLYGVVVDNLVHLYIEGKGLTSMSKAIFDLNYNYDLVSTTNSGGATFRANFVNQAECSGDWTITEKNVTINDAITSFSTCNWAINSVRGPTGKEFFTYRWSFQAGSLGFCYWNNILSIRDSTTSELFSYTYQWSYNAACGGYGGNPGGTNNYIWSTDSSIKLYQLSLSMTNGQGTIDFLLVDDTINSYDGFISIGPGTTGGFVKNIVKK